MNALIDSRRSDAAAEGTSLPYVSQLAWSLAGVAQPDT